MQKPTLGIVSLFLLLHLNTTTPVIADHSEAQAIGIYQWPLGSDILTDDYIVDEANGFILKPPALATELRVNISYLNERLPGWATDKEFSIYGSVAIFPGEEIRFEIFSAGPVPQFTLGSTSSIRLAERPMWISVENTTSGPRLNFDDGNTTGQRISVATTWLSQYNVSVPRAIHETLGELKVESSESGDRYHIAIPHFSWVLLTDEDIDIRAKVGGLFIPFNGNARWNAENKTLAIDVPDELLDYELWVERPWVDARINDLIVETYSWFVATESGKSFYVVPLAPDQTPATVIFTTFPWQYDSFSNTTWRNATTPEKMANSWTENSTLISGFNLTNARSGATWNLTVVLRNGTLVQTTWKRIGNASTEHLLAFGMNGYTPEKNDPLLYEFGSVGANYTGYIVVGSEYGLYGEFVHGNESYTFEGWESWWLYSNQPTESPWGKPLEQEIIFEDLVEDQVDEACFFYQDMMTTHTSLGEIFPNANDCESDEGGRPAGAVEYYLALMGEGKWCMRNADNFEEKLTAFFREADSGFSETHAIVKLGMGHCWFSSSISESDDCDKNGGCKHYHADGTTHDYPYNACDKTKTCYPLAAWNDVSHGRNHGSNGPGLKVAQVIHHGKLSEVYCGWAESNAASVSHASSSGCLKYMRTHEVGHNFKATHQDSAKKASHCSWWDIFNPMWTVMASADPDEQNAKCVVNSFSSKNRSNIESCVSSSFCPRHDTG